MGNGTKYPDAPRTEGEGWAAVVNAVDSLRDEIGQRHVENTTLNEEQSAKLDEVIRRVDDLHMAFPDGNWFLHRQQHEALIAKDKARAALYDALLKDLATKGMYAVIGAVALGLWWWFKVRIKSG